MSQHSSEQTTGDPWGRRLADGTTDAGEDRGRVRRLLRDAVGIVSSRLGDIRTHGIRPLLDEAAAQVRPATIDELRARYKNLPDDEVARRLTERAARTAGTVALGIGGVVAAQEAAAALTAAVPPAAVGALSTVAVTALAEVLVLFLIEAKLRADLSALAGQPLTTPRQMVAEILGEVQAAGGWTKLRRGSLRLVVPEAAARRMVAKVAPMIPRRFARIVIPEVVAPLIGGAIAARLAMSQVRHAGEAYWLEVRGPLPSTDVHWGNPEPVPSPGPRQANGHEPSS
jgi:hypothetical protein